MRQRSLSLAIVLTLTFGLAGVLGVLAIWRQVLNPYGVPGGERIVSLMEHHPALHSSFSPKPEAFEAWKRDLKSFENLAAYQGEDATLRTSQGAQTLRAIRGDRELLQMLEIQPQEGRLLDPDDITDQETGILISLGLARGLFGRARSAIGEVLMVDGVARTVVGVLPAHFESAFGAERKVDLVTCLDLQQQRWVEVRAKLRPGIAPEQAQAELDAWGAAQPEEVTEGGAVQWQLQTPLERVPYEVRRFLRIALGGCGLFLLVTLANVLHLIAAQVEKERRDAAIRWALGERRLGLLRRKLRQAAWLAMVAGLAATLLAYGGLHILKIAVPEELRFLRGATVGWLELGFAWIASLVILLVLGWLPRLIRGQVTLRHDLRTEMRLGRPSWLGKILGHGHILTMLASALVLVVGAYLVLSSLTGLRHLDVGFDPQAVQVVKVELPGWKYEAAEERAAFFQRFEERLLVRSGGTEASVALFIPPDAGITVGEMTISQGEPAGEIPKAFLWNQVRPGYFHALRQAIVAGRGFEADDLGEETSVVVISETLARRLFGSPRRAVGQVLSFQGDSLEVRGVVQDVRTEGMHRNFEGVHLYLPLHQFERWGSLLLRTDRPMGDLARTVALELDPDVVVNTASLDSRVAASLDGIRFFASLFTLLTALAIGLAVVGVYSVLNHFARRHQAQVAVRMALGASPETVRRWLLVRGMILGVLGAALGVGLSYPFGHLLQGLLFEQDAHSLTARLVAAALVLYATFLATWLPALRASRVDPVTFLKGE